MLSACAGLGFRPPSWGTIMQREHSSGDLRSVYSQRSVCACVQVSHRAMFGRPVRKAFLRGIASVGRGVGPSFHRPVSRLTLARRIVDWAIDAQLVAEHRQLLQFAFIERLADALGNRVHVVNGDPPK